ncbi:MAG: glycosyltransferase family 2 protein [Deltaproteobacteria bacterium]|nr:glycosyltransferase family 2 protein [Deltaproteobacteria bacterium]
MAEAIGARGPCVVIPAYNEAATIEGIVREIVASKVAPVIVVDDGSIDATADMARRAGAEVLAHPKNRGKGVALRTAIGHVVDRGYDPAVFLDADGQHSPGDIGRFLARWEQTRADLIIGTRMGNPVGMPLIRLFANTSSSVIVSALSGKWVSDSQSGFRLLSRRLLQRILAQGGEEGFEFESEMIVDAIRDGFSYAEVPITCIYGSERSHYDPLADSMKFLRLAARKGMERLRRTPRS